MDDGCPRSSSAGENDEASLVTVRDRTRTRVKASKSGVEEGAWAVGGLRGRWAFVGGERGEGHGQRGPRAGRAS